MEIVEFRQPDFLDGVSARSIEQRMMSHLPADIDKTEGGFAWDFTYPVALEKAELLQFYLVRTLQMINPLWAEGEWLDRHATENGLERRSSNKAFGKVVVTGQKGIHIAQGFVFAVPSESGNPSIEFETLADAVISADGIVEIPVQALEGGTRSNVGADTITIMREPIRGIVKVTNIDSLTGGTSEESDASLRERILDLLRNRGDSFVGNNADYVRWAKEIAGVGYAHPIPEYNGPNSVKLIVVDANGSPANEQILNAVKKHIFGINRRDINRLAPVGLLDFAVSAPAPVTLLFTIQVKLTEGTENESFTKALRASLLNYYRKISTESDDGRKVVKYVMVVALISHLPMVLDFKEFYINGGIKNIECSEEEYPVTGEIEVLSYV